MLDGKFRHTIADIFVMENLGCHKSVNSGYLKSLSFNPKTKECSIDERFWIATDMMKMTCFPTLLSEIRRCETDQGFKNAVVY